MNEYAKINNKMLRGIRQIKNKEKMRYGLNVSLCGKWHRANSDLKKPLYL